MKFRDRTSVPARLQRADGTAAIALPCATPLWLVGADLCLFTRLDLHDVPARFRGRAIAERARAIAPFAAPAWHAAAIDDAVLLWLWDDARVRAAMAADADIAAGAWTVLPEQVHLQPRADGACLRDTGATRVLERWSDGALRFSAALPAGGADHALWLRAAGLPVDAGLEQRPAVHVPTRWDVGAYDWRALLLDPVFLSGLFAAAMVLWLSVSVGQLAGMRHALHELDADVSARQQALSPVLAAREEALRRAAANATLTGLLGSVSALDVAAEFEHLVGGRYATLLDWQYASGKLRVTLGDDAPENRAYVEALARSPWFGNVSVAPASASDRITLDIAVRQDASDLPRFLAPRGDGG